MLARYDAIVDDPDALAHACARPLPRCVWINPLQVDPAQGAGALLQACPDARPIPWLDNGWRLPLGVKPGAWPAYRLGWFHAQEEAALWPAYALDVSPGMRVLDLCAAPGGKSAQLAVLMNDRGLLVANEKRMDRLASLRFNLERLGVTNAAVTCADGRGFGPSLSGTFDRVLVDAPCSCEGTARKRGARSTMSDNARHGLVSVQIGLMRRALDLVRPGGTIVYATCTFAPEENEAVLNALDPDTCRIEALPTPPGLVVRPGVAAWRGVVFREDVRNAVRLWPHHNDTGGFFMAKLTRSSPDG